MANPRKPTTLKAIAGTARPDREPEGGVELPLVAAPPDPPDWLPNSHAVKEWNRLVPILMANKLLTEAALGPLAHLCALHGKIVQLYAAGEAPTASMSGTLRNLQNDFGLTPVAQGKVKATGDVPAGNKFATNGKRATG
ncbi:hypothetical protein [Cupriavidus gilardii]|uniref:hypothetical protein n=1 Tax=Cupriavidus gilardii TaxID=82541 RepID=UPI0021B20CD4|nr:hypothetical protein [Cupriavidus gilardii]UXC34790.1 hypothetical protein N4G38_10085 [Cupriavidus gilardii]UXC37342.1 hypothetical protein N4G38_07870 [Cupriavidus gilardii]